MKYTASDRMNSLPFSGIRAVMEKATQMQQAGENIIHMEIGRPDFDTPEVIKKAAFSSLEKEMFFTLQITEPPSFVLRLPKN